MPDWQIYQMSSLCSPGLPGWALKLLISPLIPLRDGTIPSTNELKLTVSEALVAQFSGMNVLMTDMPGMKMTSPMSVGAVSSKVAADGKTLVGTLKTPLPAGTYTLGWHAVTADTHRVEGSYSFTVK
jgi:hypothetical protein